MAQPYSIRVTLNLSSAIEAQLRTLASQQGRDVQSLAEEAIRQYLDAANITDLTTDQIRDFQMQLAPEVADAATRLKMFRSDMPRLARTELRDARRGRD
jgi:hypothetical protein